MNVSLKQLRLLRAVADLGSVTEAARLLHITQSTASDQLKALTMAAGLPLYHLVSRRLEWTDLGENLVLTARNVLDELDRFTQVRDAMRGVRHGRLRIAAVSTAAYFIPRLVGQFSLQYPEIEVSLQILNRDGVVDRLTRNADELYIMSMPPEDLALEDRVFLSNRLHAVVAPGAKWVGEEPCTLSDLSEVPWILREPGSGTRMAVDARFRSVRFQPKIRMELGSNEAIIESVMAGLGVGVLSEHALHHANRGTPPQLLRIAGFPIASAWHVVFPKGRSLSPAAEVFHQLLCAFGHDSGSSG